MGEGVVAVLGDVFVDGRVAGDVVAAFGNVTLGPNAVVGGEVAAVGGMITRDPQATVRGPTHQVAFGSGFARLEGLRPWFERCLLYGRPLAFDKDVSWAWWVAFGFLGLYVLISLLFDSSVQRCVTTLEERPLQSLVASIVTVLLSPVMMLVLAITIIGIALVPFLSLGLFCAALFGKAVVLATTGPTHHSLYRRRSFGHVAFATFVGGLLLMIMYVVPVLGFIAYNLTGFLGLGAVAYTLMLALRAHNSQQCRPRRPRSSADCFDRRADSDRGCAPDRPTQFRLLRQRNLDLPIRPMSNSMRCLAPASGSAWARCSSTQFWSACW